MIWKKIVGKLKKHFPEYHDMSEHPGELHYFDLYWHYMENHFHKGQSAIDIGAQYGRFTKPLLQKGLEVTATDIESSFTNELQHISQSNDHLTVRNEPMSETINQNSVTFDHVLCMELIYTLPDIEKTIKGLASLVKPNGKVYCSHRNQGYYLYRYLREQNFDKIEALLQHKNEPFNHQDIDQLKQMYQHANLTIEQLVPIGMFSGFDKDPWTNICNPEELNLHKINKLKQLELNPKLVEQYFSNARYTLVIATKNDK